MGQGTETARLTRDADAPACLCREYDAYPLGLLHGRPRPGTRYQTAENGGCLTERANGIANPVHRLPARLAALRTKIIHAPLLHGLEAALVSSSSQTHYPL